MEIQEQINRQRVKHIIDSYHLSGAEADRVDTYLEELLQHYPTALIELALVETLVDSWLTIPPIKGIAFLSQSHDKLRAWESQPIISTITPEQFNQITGLDPSPIFGSTNLPPTRPIVHPS
jgi:hypothetical protein